MSRNNFNVLGVVLLMECAINELCLTPNIVYVSPVGSQVTSEHGHGGNGGGGSTGTRYYNQAPNARLLANFKPFNLEDFWGQKVVRNLNISRGSAAGGGAGAGPQPPQDQQPPAQKQQ